MGGGGRVEVEKKMGIRPYHESTVSRHLERRRRSARSRRRLCLPMNILRRGARLLREGEGDMHVTQRGGRRMRYMRKGMRERRDVIKCIWDPIAGAGKLVRMSMQGRERERERKGCAAHTYLLDRSTAQRGVVGRMAGIIALNARARGACDLNTDWGNIF